HIDRGAQAEIAAYAKAQENLSTDLDRLKVSAGSGFAEAFAIVDQAFATDIQWLSKWADKLAGANAGVGTMKTALDSLAAEVGIDPKVIQAQAEYEAILQYTGDVLLPKEREELARLLADKLKLADADNKGADIAH